MRRWRFPKYFPGWIVTGGGGSGGAATVQTDGVTIQGDGSSGNKIAIKQVETDASLSGAGTLASTLGLTAQTVFNIGANGTLNGYPNIPNANTLWLYGFFLPFKLTFSNLGAHVATADGVNNSNWGIYSAAGTRICQIGAQTFGTNGKKSIALTGAPFTIMPGPYLFAFTSAAATLNLWSVNAGTFTPWFSSSNYATTAAGALPATITAPTVTFTAMDESITTPFFALF